MSVLDVVNSYYEAWMAGKGDFSKVPLAPDFARFTVRRQFADGNTVCSIIDWEMALPVAPITAAEILQVRDGQIVRGELIYDAQEPRAAIAAGARGR